MEASPPASCPVNSSNEWDPLEEVIVGRLDGAVLPPFHASVTAPMPPGIAQVLRLINGRHYPAPFAHLVQRELQTFIEVLEAEGVRVRRPEIVDFSKRCTTRGWSSKGFCVASPRDLMLVLGDEILETPTSWRSRQFELDAYRPLLKEYFAGGARWTSAPRPQLLDELYDPAYSVPGPNEPLRYVTTEFEPVFDAADFVRCGRHIFGIRSHTTNRQGIEWLRRHVGDRFEVVEIESRCRQPMHIDSSFMPLAPGKVLVNPEFIDVSRLPPILKRWDVLIAPQPDTIRNNAFFKSFGMTSRWIGMNVLMLDPERVVVDRSQESMIRKLKEWGFQPIAVPFLHYAFYGGSFHCATLDVRRRGTLQSYF